MFSDSGLASQLGTKQETEGVCIVLELCDKFLTKHFIIFIQTLQNISLTGLQSHPVAVFILKELHLTKERKEKMEKPAISWKALEHLDHRSACALIMKAPS